MGTIGPLDPAVELNTTSALTGSAVGIRNIQSSLVVIGAFIAIVAIIALLGLYSRRRK